MPFAPGGIDSEAAVFTLITQPHFGQSPQARPIRHMIRPACRSSQMQPVQCRAATGFQIRLTPHSHIFGRYRAQRKLG
jgi:hypothetical protein